MSTALIQLRDFTAAPYEHGLIHAQKAFSARPVICLLCDQARADASPSLMGRIGHFSLTILLWMPIVNMITHIALKYFFRSAPVSVAEGVPPHVELTSQLERWSANPANGPEASRRFVIARILSCYRDRTSHLDLSGLALTTLPEGFEKFTHLKTLNLCNNQLTILPQELLIQKSVQRIQAYRNSFSPVYAQQLREHLDTVRAAGRRLKIHFTVYDVAGVGLPLTLWQEIHFWESKAEKQLSRTIGKLHKKETIALTQFLSRQKETADFQNSSEMEKRYFAEQIMKLLQSMINSAAFRNEARAIIKLSHGLCADYQAYSLDLLLTAWNVRFASPSSELEVASFIVGVARKAMIVGVVEALDDGDSVITTLRLQIVLAKMLAVPIVTRAMLYPAVSSVDDTGAHAIGMDILAKTNRAETIANLLVAHKVWRNWLQSYAVEGQYEAAIAEIRTRTGVSETERRSIMSAKLDALYLADTHRWLADNFARLKPLLGIES